MNQEEQIQTWTAEAARGFRDCRHMFLAMGDENRQNIMIVLLETFGGMRVGEIAQRVSLSRPAVSHHLKILKDAGIVDLYKDGTMHYYYMDANENQWAQVAALFQQVNQLVAAVAEHHRAGFNCFVQED